MSKVIRVLSYIITITVLSVSYTNCGGFQSSTDFYESASSILGEDQEPGAVEIPTDIPVIPDVPITDPSLSTVQKLYKSYSCEDKYNSDSVQNLFKSNIGPLTSVQYSNSVNQIFGINIVADINTRFDSTAYDSSLGQLAGSKNDIEKYFTSADKVIEAISADDQIKNKVYDCSDDSCIKTFIGKWGDLLFRRPILDSEVNKVFDAVGKNNLNSVGDKLEYSLYYLLVSPEFTYHFYGLDLSVSGSMQELNEFELASRVSFFIWGSSPDSELMDLAGKNQLKAQINEQVSRLLNSDKSIYLATQLADNWFSMGQFKTENEKNYGFDISHSNTHLSGQIALFVNHLIKNDRPVTELFNSDVMFHNEMTRKIYGLEFETDYTLREKTMTKDYLKAGVLSHAAPWALSASSGDAHVFKRGVKVIDKMLCDQLPGLPAGVDLKTDVVDADGNPLSLKESIVKHAESQACNGCHYKMDPYGIALENFDALGRYRESYSTDESINYDNKMADGTSISTVSDLGRYLATNEKSQINYCAMKNVLSLATGAEFFIGDGADTKNDNASCFNLASYNSIIDDEDITFKQLIINIISSPNFENVYKVNR